MYFLPLQTLITSSFILFIGFFVLYKDIRSKLNIVFCIFCFSVFTWLFMFSLMYLSNSTNSAIIFARLGDVGILYLPILGYLFVLILLGQWENPYKIIFYFSLILSIPIFLMSQSKYIISGIHRFYWGNYPVAGPFYFSLIIFFGLTFYSALLLYKAYKEGQNKYDQHKLQQIKFVMYAYLGAGTGLVDYLPKYGLAIYPWGHLSAVIFITLIAYAILKHHLMDINIVIRKGLIYSVLIGLLAGTYLSLVFATTKLLGGQKEDRSIMLSVISIFIFAFIFQPLRDRIQEIIDKLFFRGKYDYQKTLKDLSVAARSIAGIDELADKMLVSIADIIKINKASIHVIDKRTDSYLMRRSIGGGGSGLSTELISKLSRQKEPIVFDNLTEGTKSEFAIVFPIMSKEKLVGVLSLGDKLSGEVYSSEDIDLLTTLCNQIGVSIENAMLYEDALETQKQLYQADKLATVGVLAAGLAHEIKNPLAAIKGFSQLIDKALTDKDLEAIKDFKEVVPRQLDRINGIVEKLLMLSKPPKQEMESVSINTIIVDIVKLIEKQAIKQKVEIKKELKEIPPITGDAGQLMQALLNLILNAIQAMPEGGIVSIRSKNNGSSFHIEVEDSGPGIPKAMMSRMFDPFFTTKNGGSGLGLAITRKIIIDHRGIIRVESEEGHGSTFTIELPLTVENGQGIA